MSESGVDEPVRLLFVEDSELDADLIAHALRRGGLETDMERVVDAASFEAALRRGGFDLILSDYQLPGLTASPRCGWRVSTARRRPSSSSPASWARSARSRR